jgi:hypothetical protein
MSLRIVTNSELTKEMILTKIPLKTVCGAKVKVVRDSNTLELICDCSLTYKRGQEKCRRKEGLKYLLGFACIGIDRKEGRGLEEVP